MLGRGVVIAAGFSELLGTGFSEERACTRRNFSRIQRAQRACHLLKSNIKWYTLYSLGFYCKFHNVYNVRLSNILKSAIVSL